VVYAKKLDQSSTFDELRYILFGRGDELFLAHLLSRPVKMWRSLIMGLVLPAGLTRN
jgi:hypothetical protein